MLEWPSITNSDVEEALNRLGISYDRLVVETEKGEIEREKVLSAMDIAFRNPGYDAVFSINYYRVAAEGCYRAGIPYLAWTYDSPVRETWRNNLYYDTNWVFFYDAAECSFLKRRGEGSHLYHLPLAVNTRRYDSVYLSKREREKYGSEISFVGQLYNNMIFYLLSELPDYEKEYLTALMDVQLETYGIDVIRSSLTEEFRKKLAIPELMKAIDSDYRYQEDLGHEYPTEERLWIELQRNVSCYERLMVLELLGRYFPLKFYSFQKQETLKNVEYMGPVDTYDGMPLVFKASKINLNITSRTMVSAIPQRCLDIMAAGGFLLTNYQSEMSELFPEGTCAIYECPEDALEKARYYLSHESERLHIARAGHQLVKEFFTYEDRIKTILETAGLWKK